MRLLIERTIELLKLQVKENIQAINKNQTRITNMLKSPISKDEKKVCEHFITTNKRLLVENNDFINLQIKLTNFLEKYQDSEALSDKVPGAYCELPSDETVVFEMTIHDELRFDNLHPFFNDEAFLNKLINYYTSIEAYEKCGELSKIKNLYFSA